MKEADRQLDRSRLFARTMTDVTTVTSLTLSAIRHYHPSSDSLDLRTCQEFIASAAKITSSRLFPTEHATVCTQLARNANLAEIVTDYGGCQH